MTLLYAGLAIFFAIHLVPSAPGFRSTLVSKLGELGYKGVFALISLAGVVLIVKGLQAAPFEPLYTPPAWGRHATMLLMLPALYLFASNSLFPAPSSAKAILAHPMNWGVIVWSIGHLLSNGDLAHVLVFASFWIFSTISIVTGEARGLKPTAQRPSIASEAGFVAFILVLYAALVWGHAYFTGMPLITA
jgi:uncharacterized membrane protein